MNENRMENEMIERVAKALKAKLLADPESAAWISDYGRPEGLTIAYDGELDLVDLARPAIGAMREPTLAMIQAGWATNGYRGDMTEREWRAMIDAALGAETASPA